MRTAEQIVDGVLEILDHAAREGLDMVSVQGLQHLVGTREEVAAALATRRQVQALIREQVQSLQTEAGWT